MHGILFFVKIVILNLELCSKINIYCFYTFFFHFPRIFWLQVGRERQSAFCLMQKYVDLQPLGTKLQIISVFSVDRVKGFIFIEAKKQQHIYEVFLFD